MELNFQLNKIDEAAETVLQWLNEQGATVIALSGGMGAGKTTFTAALLRATGSSDVAGSPTFSIINQYADAAGNAIYHMDLYRLRNEEEAIQAGIEDCLYSGNLCVVEWPEKAASLLPGNTLYLQITAKEEGTRVIAAAKTY